MRLLRLTELDSRDPDTGDLNVIVETPKGSHNKIKYMPKTGVFAVHRVLPMGLTFPFDFGFVPSTLAEDGDPLDVLLLMDHPTPVGCIVPSRILGVVKIHQRKKQKMVRNDRIIAVASGAVHHHEGQSANHFDKSVLHDVERFFTAYHDEFGEEYRVLEYAGAKSAERLLRRATKRFRGAGGG